jgi:hypothetical protein
MLFATMKLLIFARLSRCSCRISIGLRTETGTKSDRNYRIDLVNVYLGQTASSNSLDIMESSKNASLSKYLHTVAILSAHHIQSQFTQYSYQVLVGYHLLFFT